MDTRQRKARSIDGQLELNVICPVGDAADAFCEAQPLLVQLEGMLVRARAMTIRIATTVAKGNDAAEAAYRGAVVARWGADDGVSTIPPMRRRLAGVVQ